MKTEIEIKISDFSYARDGQLTVANTLILYAPSARHDKLVFRLTQILGKMFKQSISENTAPVIETPNRKKKDEHVEEVGISGKVLMGAIYSSSTVNIDQFLEFTKRLLLSGVCVIAPISSMSRQELTDGIYDNLTMRDIEKIMGEYLANFLMPSLLLQE